ncbi:MAG: DUF4214 domain-containing protein [Candidatus Hodarchaeales archaeon]|jgi:hypothetical protein
MPPDMSRQDAEEVVGLSYENILDRNPFTQIPYDAAAYDYVIALMYEKLTLRDLEDSLRNSEECFEKSKATVTEIYNELLGRDPDPAAYDYFVDLQLGVKTEEEIREEIKQSEEYKDKVQTKASTVSVIDNVLMDVQVERKEFELGISLFYAMSSDVTRTDYLSVINELATHRIRQVRFAGSTFTWDNPLKKANVIPFKSGNTYIHDEGLDKGKGVDPIPDQKHFEELSWRLNELANKGIRAQYTVFWGGMKPLFTNDGRSIKWKRVETYLGYVARFFANRRAHTIEVINEADHGHHLARLGQDGRVEFLKRCCQIIRKYYPSAVITASDGGRQPTNEGAPYFAYHEVQGLDYWNVHFPRDQIQVEGIPRWCRGSWHLYGDRYAFRKGHKKGGYGRSDENIFLRTEDEAKKWGYRGATLDWRMYGTMLWVTTMAGCGLTLHTHKGFFCEKNVTTDSIFQIVRGWNHITDGFSWHGASSFNTGWAHSPIKEYRGCFKAFILKGHNSILVTVLNPNQGILYFDKGYAGTVYEIDGDLIGSFSKTEELSLPASKYPHALVIRMEG